MAASHSTYCDSVGVVAQVVGTSQRKLMVRQANWRELELLPPSLAVKRSRAAALSVYLHYTSELAVQIRCVVKELTSKARFLCSIIVVGL